MSKSASGFHSLILLLCSLIIAGCSTQSDKTLQEQAASLFSQANTEINNYNFQNAEQLLTKSIRITEGLNDKAKLVELYSTLSNVHLSLGKYSWALSDLSMVRNFYSQIADRKSEIPVMIEMGKLSFKLGMEDESVSILKEAILSSQIHQFEMYTARASYELGTILHASGKDEEAASLFLQASKIYTSTGDTVQMVNASVNRFACLMKLHKTIDAIEIYTSLEQLLVHGKISTNVARTAYTECGFAFLSAQEWNAAGRLFRRADAVGTQQERETDPQPLIGLGELYYNNFAFAEAQQQFEKAFEMSKQIFGTVTEAYLSTRIADCDVRLSEYSHSPNNQQRLIAASQYYERAQSIFTRLHVGIGEALILHRIGMQKELAEDDNAAITYYKYALSTYTENAVAAKFLTLPIDISTLWSGISEHYSPEEWLCTRLITILLRNHRYEEAYHYLQLERSHYLQNFGVDKKITFRDPSKNKLFKKFVTTKNTEDKLELESVYAAREKNRNYLLQVQEQLTTVRNDLKKISFAQFPELSFLVPPSDSSRSIDAVPTGTTVLDYFIGNNECWVFVLQNESDITALKLSSFGYELERKMTEYINQIRSAKKNTDSLYDLSETLYKILIQPVEKFGRQRFVIIPPPGLEKFPFHTLSKNGKPLVSMIEVSYFPSSRFMQTTKRFPRFVNNVIAFGYTSDSRWGLEFELRDIRSFFRNAQVYVNQNATNDNLNKMLGEVLQISSHCTSSTDGNFSITLSDGNPSPVGIETPITSFTDLHPFPLVYLADIDSKSNDINLRYSLYWLMNGTSSVITTEFPVDAKMTRMFGETFYSTLASTISPYTSYREAVQRLSNEKELSDSKEWGSFFYYGW